jgi:hypothetical protein
MEQKDITLTIDGKMHKLMDDRLVPCPNCSLYKLCGGKLVACPAVVLGGDHFVELKVEK